MYAFTLAPSSDEKSIAGDEDEESSLTKFDRLILKTGLCLAARFFEM